MKIEDFDKLRGGDVVVSHNRVSGESHRGVVTFAQLGPVPNRVGRVQIKWDDNSEQEVWRDELFEFPEIFDTFTVEPK